MKTYQEEEEKHLSDRENSWLSVVIQLFQERAKLQNIAVSVRVRVLWLRKYYVVLNQEFSGFSQVFPPVEEEGTMLGSCVIGQNFHRECLFQRYGTKNIFPSDSRLFCFTLQTKTSHREAYREFQASNDITVSQVFRPQKSSVHSQPSMPDC